MNNVEAVGAPTPYAPPAEVLDIYAHYDIFSSMKKALGRPSASQIAREIREVAKDSANVFFTVHAEDEMKVDRLPVADVLQVLRGCRVIEIEPSGRYKTEGRTAIGEAVAAIVQILVLERDGKGLRVITVWRINSR